MHDMKCLFVLIPRSKTKKDTHAFDDLKPMETGPLAQVHCSLCPNNQLSSGHGPRVALLCQGEAARDTRGSDTVSDAERAWRSTWDFCNSCVF